MRSLAMLVFALVLAGCSQPVDEPIGTAATGTTSGGIIADVPAVFSNYTVSPTTVYNDGTGVVLFNFTVHDDNGETDIASVGVFSNATAWGNTHIVTGGERAATSEPTTYGADGWKAWSVAKHDGTLYFSYRYPVPSGAAGGTFLTGTRATNPNAIESYPAPSTHISFVIKLPTLVTVASAPVSPLGAPLNGTSWGDWSANPGDSNVPAGNYLKLTNNGPNPTPQVVIDFTPTSFTGVSDPTIAVAIDNNIQFAWWEDVNGTAKPNAGTYTWLGTSPGGSVTVTFTGTSRVIYVTYRVVSVPAILAAQSFGATFTATDI